MFSSATLVTHQRFPHQYGIVRRHVRELENNSPVPVMLVVLVGIGTVVACTSVVAYG